VLLFGSSHWRWGPIGFGPGTGQEMGLEGDGSPGTMFEILEGVAGDPGDPVAESTVEIAAAPAGTNNPPVNQSAPTVIPKPTSVAGLTKPPTTTPTISAASLPVFGTSGSAFGHLGGGRDAIQGSQGNGGGGGGNGGTGTGGGNGSGGGIPGAGFLGLRDRGTRVIYVIDCSTSMANDNAMRTAKAALVASLQSLTESQQFQIVFYNNAPSLMKLRNASPGDLAYATEVNKTFARQYIAGIEPDLGTNHVPALQLALRLKPEVLFFLTDADEPQITPGELQELQRLNQGKTRIHTIEFGRGGELGENINFLKKLASQNGGTYRYHDVRRSGESEKWEVGSEK
jgi:hypothetical protein